MSENAAGSTHKRPEGDTPDEEREAALERREDEREVVSLEYELPYLYEARGYLRALEAHARQRGDSEDFERMRHAIGGAIRRYRQRINDVRYPQSKADEELYK